MLGDLGKLIVAKGFKKLPKVQKIARSGHTACSLQCVATEMDKLASSYYAIAAESKWTQIELVI